MSQIYKALTSGPVPPSVPTTFETQNGDATPALNILIVSANDTIENDVDGLRTVGGGTDGTASNEVQVELTNRLQGTASVTGAVTGDIITFALSDTAAVYRFEFKVAGRDTATGDAVGYTVFASARTDGASATIVETPFYDADEDASLSTAQIDVVASANSIILQSTGVASQTINYSAVGFYLVV